MKNKKKYVLAGAAFAVLLSAAALLGVLLRDHMGNGNPNLALQKGVKAACDSVEREELSAAMAIDGDDVNRSSRWSSENNREDASHYIQLEFPKEISVSFVVLKWERRNVISYALESSPDGGGWETLQSFETAPETLKQEIVLEKPVRTRYLRLVTYAVSKETADYSDLYQNVSLYEFEVYGDKPTAYKLETPVVETAPDGGRRLAAPEAPAGFRVSLIGADLEQVIGADGTVYDTIQDKEVTVGYRVEDLRGREETREVSFRVQVPAGDDSPEEKVHDAQVALAESEELERNACPDWVIPSVAEWSGGRGVFAPGEESRIIVDSDSRPPETGTGTQGGRPDGSGPDEAVQAESGNLLPEAGTGTQGERADGSEPDEAAQAESGNPLPEAGIGTQDGRADGDGPDEAAQAEGGNPSLETGTGTQGERTDGDGQADEEARALWDVAALLCGQLEKSGFMQTKMTVCEGTLADAGPGDIYLGYAETANGLGREGYTCDITDKCVIKAETATGVRWGTVTLLQLISGGETRGSAPRGQIRDYPLYEVRGFGIDVARKAVSLDTLYAMMEAMSWYKMNDLAIHLNDNVILATSGLTESAEQAMTADSAFRLESGLGNEKGEKLTSAEYAYTKEEFDRFIRTAGTYGVTVVPEIDTPAHSLSITKLYPEYALDIGSEAVDQIDLGNGQAVALVEKIWREALSEEDGAFRQAQVVNIGMDEYYGDGEQYRQYLTRINELVQGTGKTVRLWGSLSNIDGTAQPSPENLQMNLWSTLWADPRGMYEAGYSLINMQSNHLYIIPGGGYDYLDSRELRENWAPDRFYDYNQMETIPAYSPQMLGAAYMIWNDMSGRLDVGICEYDLYERFREPLEILSAKLWGPAGPEGKAGQEGQAFSSGRRPVLRLYDETVAAEPDYEIQMKVWLEPEEKGQAGQPEAQTERGREQAGQPEAQTESGREKAQSAAAEKGQSQAQTESAQREAQILAEGDCAYGEWAFYAVEPGTGKVGFTREGRTYTFDYVLPRGEWVSLKLEGKSGQTLLYVEGKEVDRLGSGEPFEEHATFVFPLQRVGAQTAHFDGKLELTVQYGAEGHV